MKDLEIGDIILAQYASHNTVPVLVAKVEVSSPNWFVEGHVITPNSSAYEVKWGRVFESEDAARAATPIQGDEILCWRKEDPTDKLIGELILLLSSYHTN